MRTYRHLVPGALLGVAAALAFGAAPAGATVCPGGINPATQYCVDPLGPFFFPTLVLSDTPEAWYRMNDGEGAETMADSSGNFHDGEYKNGQDSGPVGISGDGDTARDFWGENGYGYANGIPAPGPDNHYSNYTVEAWFYLEETDSPADPFMHNDGTIVDFGRGPSIYILSNNLMFTNGDDTITYSGLNFRDETWYQVVARKSGNKLRLFVNQSPTSPTPFNYTPAASGFSTYRPGGSPTFYVGYGAHAPWFRGAIDEVSYYKYALTDDQIAYHFYADPAPVGKLKLGRPATVASGGSNPSGGGTFTDPSSNKPPAVKPKGRAAKLRAAKAEVKRLTTMVAKAKRMVGSLKHHHAKARDIKKAQAKLKSLQKQLKRAKIKVLSLTA